MTNEIDLLKQNQLSIVNKYNPILDSYHVGIRKVEDIKTWDEVLSSDDEYEGQFVWGDYSREDALRDKERGLVNVYSSKPIKQGNFISTSRIQAEEYAGGPGSKIYQQEVPFNKIAWINGDEGQFADVDLENSLNHNVNIMNKALNNANKNKQGIEFQKQNIMNKMGVL